MPDANELQRVIADAWAAGYAARETELVCRRRSSIEHRKVEAAHFVQNILSRYMPRVIEATRTHDALSS
ncbi:MAG: hypothetical protein H7Y32_20815 [Chloroflexales bacterium]|nr:hypothetical protein [Chloroflexales bacterium]